MLEQGQAQKELLAKHGLADRLLEDLSAAVAEFDASVETTNDTSGTTWVPGRSWTR